MLNMKQYICLAGSKNLEDYNHYMTYSPLECKYDHCLRAGHEYDWELIKDKCFNRRVKKIKKEGENKIK